MSILLDAFKLAPKDAIAFLKKKGFRFSWDYTQVMNEEHARAFTVAKVMRMDILQDIKDALETSMKEGTPFAKFQKELKPLLQAKGWWGPKMIMDEKGQGNLVQLGSPYRLRTIYDTNMQSALMKGRYDGMMQATEMRPFWQYIHPPIAKVPRQDHVALNGMIFRYDDPFWNTHYPPNGYGCHCRVRSLSQREVDRSGLAVSSGDGKMVDKEVLNERTGLLTTVTGYKTIHEGKQIVVFTDVGFNYNPGKVDWKPDPKAYDKDILAQYNKERK
jgi:SPP1 gp7 family putative phage head morphogenesis protein